MAGFGISGVSPFAGTNNYQAQGGSGADDSSDASNSSQDTQKTKDDGNASGDDKNSKQEMFQAMRQALLKKSIVHIQKSRECLNKIGQLRQMA